MRNSAGVSEIIFAGAKNAAPKGSLALLLHVQYVAVISREARVTRICCLRWLLRMSYYNLRLDEQQFAPVILLAALSGAAKTAFGAKKFLLALFSAP